VKVLSDPPPLSFLGLDHCSARRPALAIEAPHHPLEGRVQSPHIRAVQSVWAQRVRRRGGGIELLHRPDQLVERHEAPSQEDPIGQHRGNHGETEDQQLTVLGQASQVLM
jgi:hypothetical protein